MAARVTAAAGWEVRRSAPAYVVPALIAWYVLVGGTDAAFTSTALRTVDALIGAALVAIAAVRLPHDRDRLDTAVGLALLAFVVAAMLSRFPRQSFDAAMSATAYAAAFYLARRALADPVSRGRAIRTLAVLGLGLGVGFGVAWSAAWLEWGRLTDFVAFPPIDLRVPIAHFRHAQVVGLLVALLLPALVLVAWRDRGPRAVVWMIGIGAALLTIFISGSRSTWLGLLAAALMTLALAIGRSRVDGRLRRWWFALAVIGLAAIGATVVLLASGVGGALLDRFGDTATLGGRARMWAAAIEAWRESPIVGMGPGTFPILLSGTSYYDLMAFTPRHADNAVVQLLAEAGLLGAGGLVLVLLVWSGAAGRARSAVGAASVAAVVCGAVASLADNPTDSANLVVVGLVWAAIASPVTTAIDAAPRAWRLLPLRPARAAAAVAAVLVGSALVATTVAAFAYDVARGHVRSGDLERARAAVRLAARLDPGSALYARDQGVLAFATGDLATARTDLARALSLNPADDTTHRGLAAIASVLGDHGVAIDHARTAAALQSTETVNHLLLGWVAGRADESDLARMALVRALQQAPWVTASSWWRAPFPTGDRLAPLVDDAAAASTLGTRNPPNVDIQPAWLAAMADRDELRDEVVAAAPELPRTTSALLDVFACDATSALAALEAGFAEEGHMRPYWTVRLFALRASGERANDILGLASMRASEAADALRRAPRPLSPVSDGEQDLRFYRREALPAVDVGVELPSPRDGLGAWLRAPATAAREVAPSSDLADCP